MLRKSLITTLSFLVSLGVVLFSIEGIAAEEKEKMTIGIVYGIGGKFDKAFNESAYNGMEKFKKETGIQYKEYEILNETQGEQFLRMLARKGTDLIVTTGFNQAKPVEKVAQEFPNIKFAIVDVVVDLPNVQSIIFKEQEGSYIVGALAAMKTNTQKLGFIGGMDVPLIRRFGCGFAQGAKSVNPKIEVVQNMVGSTPAAWSDPTRANELAISQYERGVDIIFTAAGHSSMGVLQASRDKGKYSIAVDANNNGTFPGNVLTSMVKNVNNAVYDVAMHSFKGEWKPGIAYYGLKEGGLEWALDDNNRSLITKDMIEKINELSQAIIDGKLKVINYTDKNTCPV